MVKKGALQKLVEQTATRSFNSLLKTCVTPYISFPKTAAQPGKLYRRRVNKIRRHSRRADRRADRTCLHLYSHHEEIQAVNWLLDAGASVHARTKDGRTPLHIAADRNNNMMVCALLLAHGANSEAIDTMGKRPVDYARENHKTKIIALLDRQ